VLVFPDGSEVRVTASGRVFGKLDYATPSPKIPQNDLQFISRQHFTIYQDQDRYYVEDNNSTNNTMLNGEEIKGKGRRELKDGDEISPAGVTKTQFRIR
jgi:pSer/pThr/pTyr-binding forkhead associated (FHA) protein